MSWPHYDDEVIDAVSAVLRSGKINSWTGEEVTKFENEFAKEIGTRFAVAVANGTVAIELALSALGISSGDEVIVTSRTFVASASAIIRVGATPVFADVDKHSQNITLNTIRPMVTERTKAIITVHLAGYPCEMDDIMEYANDMGYSVIEDCAQAHGAKYRGLMVGSIGIIGAWSFCQDKIMSTGGEGGMITLNDETLYKKIWSEKDHGKNLDLVRQLRQQTDRTPGFKWLHTTVGTNLRMTEMQATIGRILLRRLSIWVDKRRHFASIFNREFGTIPLIRTTPPPDHIYHSYYKYYVFIRENQLAEGWNRDRILQEIVDAGVPCYSGSCSEIYMELAFEPYNLNANATCRLPIAQQLGETSLMFLVHPTLEERDIKHNAEIAKSVFQKAMCTGSTTDVDI